MTDGKTESYLSWAEDSQRRDKNAIDQTKQNLILERLAGQEEEGDPHPLLKLSRANSDHVGPAASQGPSEQPTGFSRISDML